MSLIMFPSEMGLTRISRMSRHRRGQCRRRPNLAGLESKACWDAGPGPRCQLRKAGWSRCLGFRARAVSQCPEGGGALGRGRGCAAMGCGLMSREATSKSLRSLGCGSGGLQRGVDRLKLSEHRRPQRWAGAAEAAGG